MQVLDDQDHQEQGSSVRAPDVRRALQKLQEQQQRAQSQLEQLQHKGKELMAQSKPQSQVSSCDDRRWSIPLRT